MIFKRIYLFIFIFYISKSVNVFATWPDIKCEWLPWCDSLSSDDVLTNIADFIWEVLIQYVSVLAVIALMISWIMYLVSTWDEDKVKRAKNWIIWSLVWVFLSISAWFIINLINNLSI